MANYNYDVGLEAFRRDDKRGKPLYVNIVEANRIVNLINLGHSVADITGKVSLSNPKGTVTTINSFIKNYNEGNINMPNDAPAPVNVFDSLTESDRIDNLEHRIDRIEQYLDALKIENTENIGDKVKSWLKF